ncbi:MAG: S8 family serine peptidase, partial [Caulobacterales bacterium]|nr:S8 family serine peptidase [Caulobacterales bacterium]
GLLGGSLADIVDAIRWSAGLSVPGAPDNETPARVINMSLGGSARCDAATQAAIDDATAAGALVVAAAGNESSDASGSVPAGCDNVLTVAASDIRGVLTSYSNFGDTVEILAPGGDTSRDRNGDGFDDGVLSTLRDGVASYNGTSMASPHVAGVAALLLAEDPSRTPAELTQIIQDSAIPRTSAQCPRPCGAGLLNATP